MTEPGRLGDDGNGRVFHPTAIELAGLIDGDEDVDFLGRAADVVEHVKGCIDCRAKLLVARLPDDKA